jgi:hypothetical protein
MVKSVVKKKTELFKWFYQRFYFFQEDFSDKDFLQIIAQIVCQKNFRTQQNSVEKFTNIICCWELREFPKFNIISYF